MTQQTTQPNMPKTYAAGNRAQPFDRASTPTPSSAWTGWVVFAGVMLLLIGTINVIDGLVALLNSDWYVATESALLTFDFTAWGWGLLLLGVAQIAAGFGVMVGNVLARTVGVIVASINLIAQLTFISAYPAWSLVAIALDVVVIFALVAHGRDVVDE